MDIVIRNTSNDDAFHFKGGLAYHSLSQDKAALNPFSRGIGIIPDKMQGLVFQNYVQRSDLGLNIGCGKCDDVCSKRPDLLLASHDIV